MSTTFGDDSIGINCQGCGDVLTLQNIGGYQCFCDKCVMAIPPLPTSENGRGFHIEGTYPNFKWMPAI